MSDKNQSLETLKEIKDLMNKSTKFLSLSGMSGIFAGSIALVGACIAFYVFGKIPFDQSLYYDYDGLRESWQFSPYLFLLILAVIIFILALLSAWYWTNRKAKKQGETVWNQTSKVMLFHLLVPLFVGFIFCVALYRYSLVFIIPAVTLIFYGLALISSSKYTFRDIQYLGFAELFLGIIGLFLEGMGLELWAIGFGICHIGYGILMHYKYDRGTL